MVPPSSCLQSYTCISLLTILVIPTPSVRDVTSQILLKETPAHPCAVWLLPCSLCPPQPLSPLHGPRGPWTEEQKRMLQCCPTLSICPQALWWHRKVLKSLWPLSLSCPLLSTDNIQIITCSTSTESQWLTTSPKALASSTSLWLSSMVWNYFLILFW